MSKLAGGTPDRLFRAFDARTGDQLWSFPLPSGAIGVPTSFAVDGEQYVAVTTGWDLDARGVQNGLDKINGTTTTVPQGGTILVFKLSSDQASALGQPALDPGVRTRPR